MIYICRLFWLIGYIPVFILQLVMFFFLIFAIPIVATYAFIKTGYVENGEDILDCYLNVILWIDEKYKNILEKIEKRK